MGRELHLTLANVGSIPSSYGLSSVGLEAGCLILELQIPTPAPQAHASCFPFSALILGNGLKPRSHLGPFSLHFQCPVSLQAYS